MVANQKSTPVGAIELKAVIYQKIGHERADIYFGLLKRFLSLELKKCEFNESCMQIIGRDNLSLHNQLIRTILEKPSVGEQWKSQQSETGQLSLGSRPPIEVTSVEDGVEQADGSPGIQSKSPVTAPLGISIYKGPGEALSSGSQQKFHPLSCQQTCELPDARSLMIILERKLEMEGLKISVECANVLNNGLDCYLKRLIEPCLRLAGSRRMKELPQHIAGQRSTASNGMLPASGIFLPKPSNSICASLSDFCVVMESNPCILGGDWAVLREKACARAFEE